MKQDYFTLKHIKKTHTLQHDQSDCGVACLLSIIKLYGGNQSLEKLRELSGTNKQGTTLLGLYQAANKLGFDAQGAEADIKVLEDHGEPVILHTVLENRLQHYLVCYGYDSKKGFSIGDPAKGLYYLSKAELDKIWGSKTCLTLAKNNSFVSKEQDTKAQKDWFINLLKEDKKFLGFSVLLGAFVASLGMAMAVFSQKLIDDILPSQNISKLITGIVLLAILLLARVGFSVLREYFLIQQSRDFNNRINNQFYTSLLQLPKPFFDTRRIGDFVARLNDTQRIQRVIKMLASNLIIDVLVAIISTAFLFMYSWQVGLIAIVSLPIYFYIIYKSNAQIIKSQKEVMQAYSLNESNYITSMQGIATIKNNNRQELFKKSNKLIFGNYQNKIFDLGKVNIKLSWQSGLASVIFLMGILSFASSKVFYNQMELGELMAILGISGSLLPSIANLALISIPINEAKIAFKRMYEYAAMDKEKDSGKSISAIKNIQINNLSFRFAGNSQLLSNINLSIKKGEITAIVGESGSGKSTLGQILQGFYPYENGSIEIDEEELSKLSLKGYRKLIGVIPQDITIFNGNVIDNILLGKTAKPEELQAFIEKYSLDRFFNKFPQGLATILGEEGVNISGGQKQMIALARVLYKEPQLLILDESTAAMDRKTEHFSLNLIQEIKKNCAVLFISHRLHTLKNYADTIYVLDSKNISAFGSHEELMETSNFYSDFWLATEENLVS
jgi:ATP-binding cassette subfamily B protein